MSKEKEELLHSIQLHVLYRKESLILDVDMWAACERLCAVAVDHVDSCKKRLKGNAPKPDRKASLLEYLISKQQPMDVILLSSIMQYVEQEIPVGHRAEKHFTVVCDAVYEKIVMCVSQIEIQPKDVV